MARNREFVNTTPPQSSDEEDDDDTSSEGISDTDSDASIKTPVKTQPPKEGEEEGDDESGSETDSGSDSDSPAKPLVEEARMVSSKRPAERSSASKELKKMKKAEDYSSAAKELKKTKAGDAEADAAEKKIDEAEASEKKSLTKKADEVGPSEKKSNLFQRLWSEDDELAILQGMIDYPLEKKADPSADIGSFLDFIKEKLHVDVSKMQLQDKMRRLKKKYLNKAKQGDERTFSKLHERTSYELSQRIWKKTDLPKLSAAERDLMNGKGEPGGGSGSVGRTTDESMLRMGQEWMGETEGWDLLREEEFEASMNQLKVRVRQYERVLSYMRSKRRNRLG